VSKRYEDPRDRAQFSSLWQVVVHATDGDTSKEERLALMDVEGEAYLAMVRTGRWGDYRMVRNAKGQHLGYRLAARKDWFLIPEGGSVEQADGPFKTKKLILHKLRVKTSRKRAPGIYDVPARKDVAPGFTLFTRDQAEAIFGADAEEKLP
jgi:hypothetical protein